MGKKPKKWMREAFDPKKKGRLRKQLGVPADKRIPVTFMREIQKAPIGSKVKNPTDIGKKKVTITNLLKKRVNPVLTARDVRKRK